MKKIIALILTVVAISCSEEKIQPQVADTVPKGEIPSHESWNAKVTFTDEGRIKAILFADHLKKFELQKITQLEIVKIDFYNREQLNTSSLTSRYGKVDDTSSDMYAIENVVAANDSGTVLTTSELMWRNRDQKIITDKFVSIKSKKEIIEGYGLESDQNLTNYVVFNVTYSATLSRRDKK